MNMEALIKKHIRDIPDFPKPGIVFKDITPILSSHNVFDKVLSELARRYRERKIDAVIGVESRGFIFGAPLARELGVAFIPVRKVGKLPYDTIKHSYDLEYGSATLEIHTDAISKGQQVVIIDDLLATGGTVEAACHLVEKLGGIVQECGFVVELGFLKGREKIGAEVFSLVNYD